jgi:hypothetical protein
MGPRQLVTMSAYARMRGVTPQAVSKAAKAGRITLCEGRIDVAVADVQWPRNTDAVQQARGYTGGAGPKAPGPLASGELELGVGQASGGAGQATPEYFGHRSRHEAAKAEMAELELAERRGELVNAAAVERAAFEQARAARDRLMAIPDRLAAELAAETDARRVHEKITAEILLACRVLAGEAEVLTQ